jgi:hypothetical protein
MFLEYLTNIYVLPLISTIIGLSMIYLYDKFEKKQYTSAVYLRIGVLLYISTYITLYISKLDCLTSLTHTSHTQSGGNMIDPQLSMPQANDMKSHFEQFKIGVPTF